MTGNLLDVQIAVHGGLQGDACRHVLGVGGRSFDDGAVWFADADVGKLRLLVTRFVGDGEVAELEDACL